MGEKRTRGERNESGFTKHEIIKFLFMGAEWISEPEIREHISSYLGIIEPKSTKLQLASALTENIVNKEQRRGVNYWKINIESPAIPSFVLKYLSQNRHDGEIYFFYKSPGMQKYLEKVVWDEVLQLTIIDINSMLGKNRMIRFNENSLFKEMVLETVHFSPTLFVALMYPDAEYLLFSNLVYLQIPDADTPYLEYDDNGKPFDATDRLFYESDMSISSFIIAGLLIDYYQYPPFQEKIIAYLFNLSKRRPYLKYDILLKTLMDSMPRLSEQIFIGSHKFE